jgi:putative transposase
LYSLDATLIDLSLQWFPWSHYALGKGAIKLQATLDHRGMIPAFVAMTDGKLSDSDYAKTLTLPRGCIVVFSLLPANAATPSIE